MSGTFQVGFANNGFHFAADCAHHVAHLVYLDMDYLRFRRQNNADGSVDFVLGVENLGAITATHEVAKACFAGAIRRAYELPHIEIHIYRLGSSITLKCNYLHAILHNLPETVCENLSWDIDPDYPNHISWFDFSNQNIEKFDLIATFYPKDDIDYVVKFLQDFDKN